MMAVMILAAALIVPAALAQTTATPASQISIMSYETDPLVFISGDTGTIKVTIKNTGAQSVDIKRATVYSKDVDVLNSEAYATVGAIGPGVSKDFTFTVRAKKSDAIYYPKFYIEFSNSGSLSYLIPLKVESTPLEVSLVTKPDSFQKDVKDTITISIGNPRENAINGIVVRPESTTASFTQTSRFIGELESDQSSEVSFDVTPAENGEIRFITEYRNGINSHESVLRVPVSLEDGKKNADPVVNNIEVVFEGAGYKISGDVTNAGLENAKSVVVTTAEPAVPTEPNRLYVIGELEPDDFSSFDVTFLADGENTVPLVISYKDEDGNQYSKTVDISLGSNLPGKKTDNTKNSTSSDEGFPIGIAVLVLVIIASVGGAIYYSWKKQ
ncbi:hypothetical protein F1737_09525 [Methanoplanus sp. FWC-SCC4]|uniref:S-layer protein n=2 Tax=Methanochimaera problematica TaxID=2609417 RepID=A0AA97FFP8_9EURY|nr:hypothetical protein F1737_09525 [Methanoplanus sp. FWC-SCC4]